MNDFYVVLAIFGSFFFLFGSIFWLIGFIRKRGTKDWAQTSGEIIKKEKTYNITLAKIIKKEGFLSEGPDQRPTAEYVVDGQTYTYTSNIGQTPGIQPGTIVDILYDPYNPSKAIINTFVQSGAIFKLIGLILIGVTLLSFLTILILYLT